MSKGACSRRDVLAAAAAGLIARLAGTFPAAAAGAPTILVILAQKGGCDMLNTVIPLRQYGRYADYRKPQTTPYDKVLGLDIPLAALASNAFDRTLLTGSAAAEFAFHPRMRGLRQLYAAGKVAVVLGIGLPPQEANRLSHEAAVFDWQTGTTGASGFATSGWLGSSTLARSTPLPALVSVSGDIPTLMQGGRTEAIAVSAPLERYTATVPADTDEDRERRRVLAERIRGARSANPVTDGVRSGAARVATSVATVAELASRVAPETYPQTESSLGQQLASIARLIAAGNGSRVYFALQDGYDTHVEQQRSHPDLVADFSEQIAAFYRFLRTVGAAPNVVVMSYTDFGRRAKGDQNFGTDHGTAAVTFFVGDRVKGGVYGEYPDLRRLDDDGNVRVGVDFREQIAEAAQFLGLDVSAVAGRSRPLGCLRA